MSTSHSAIHHPQPHIIVSGSDVRRLSISDILGKSKKCLSSKLLGISEAVHDRLMFAMRSLAGDLKVLSSMSEAMAKFISSIGFVFLFDRVRVKGVIMAKIVASDGETGDSFGWSASMYGNYALVGANDDAVGTFSDQGSVYVFMRSGTSWNQQAVLTASDGAANDEFGNSVSLSGDYALIGAPYDEDGGNSYQGAAYIFMRSSNDWNQQTKLSASDGAANDYFGLSVSLSGDYALIGAYYKDVSANSNQGSAYIFMRSGTAWNQQSILTASDGSNGDWFGWSVSIDGDYALIAAPSDDVGGNTDQGSAYIYMRSGTSWGQQAKLTASDGDTLDQFGYSVAIDDDYVIVGAYSNDVSGNSDQGAAYIFMRSGTAWNQQSKLTASDGAAFDSFGSSVSLSGDYALIGAYLDEINGNSNQGSAYIFMRSGSDWDEDVKLIASNGDSFDGFGIASTLDGEYAMVGASGYDTGRGAVYSYCLDNQTWGGCIDGSDDDDDMQDDDGSMMIGGVSILGLSLISLFLMIM